MEKLIFLTVLSAFLCDASKILMVSPLASKSHGILGDGVVNNLLSSGHEVTYITAFPKNINHPKLHVVDVSSLEELFEESTDMINIKQILDKKQDGTAQIVFLMMFHDVAIKTIEHQNVQRLLQDSKQHFDLIIAEWMFNELYSGLAGLYEAPFIWLSTIEPHFMILNLIDDYANPAFNPYFVDASPPFTFYQRFKELWYTIGLSAFRETYILYKQVSAYNTLFTPLIKSRGRVAPSFTELRYNASLVLGNSHVSMGQATRLPQSYKAVGGYHIDETPKPLSQDLKKLLDEGKNGVIYFSMGSNLKSKDIPDQLKASLLEVFGSLKQTVLWKFEEKLPNLPKNVHILDWAPQQSILSHPNCVLFITHGGLLSTTETISAGKPIIGIPVFADQFVNVALAVNKGFAKKVDLSYTMGPELKDAIEDTLGNPRYTETARKLSFIYHDRPMTPRAELKHWVDHVIKTKGALHLRSPALLVPWYQKLYLDLVVLVLIILYIVRTAMKRILSMLPRKKSDIVKNNKKKN